VDDVVEAEGGQEGEGGEGGDAMEMDEAEGAGAKEAEPPAKGRKKSEQVYLSVLEVVLQKSTPTQIRQLILYYY